MNRRSFLLGSAAVLAAPALPAIDLATEPLAPEMLWTTIPDETVRAVLGLDIPPWHWRGASYVSLNADGTFSLGGYLGIQTSAELMDATRRFNIETTRVEAEAIQPPSWSCKPGPVLPITVMIAD